MNRPSQKEETALSFQQRVDELCLRFERAWKANQRPALEDFLGDTPEPERSVLCRELIALEVAYRRRAGENPRREEYEVRFPFVDLTRLFASTPVSGEDPLATLPFAVGQ